MAEAGTLLAVLRGLHLAAALSLLGAVGFRLWVLPVGADTGLARTLARLSWMAGLASVLTAVAWFVLQSAAIAGAADPGQVVAALPVVAEHTRYGEAMVARMGLLLGATLLAGASGKRLYPALLLAAAAVSLQAVIGHAGALPGRAGMGVMASETLHLLAAGIWLGALPLLWLSLGRLPAPAGAALCERFSPIGLACVLVVAGTGLMQGLALIGGVPALLGTHYGHLALLKLVLFAAALSLAGMNRLWLTDRLNLIGTRRGLRLSIAGETLVGLAVIMAAAFLASAVPAGHEAPVWPFSWRFSLTTLTEEPDFRREVVVSLVLIGLTVLALTAAVLWGRFRIIAGLALAAIIVVRGPSLQLLTVEAYPTSFQTSPTGFAAASIVRGQALYGQRCASCHGAEGRGDGALGAGLRIRPADLTMPHLWEHQDGELFWWLTHGIDDPEGGLAMPGFADLKASDRWALIDYIRAHNAAMAMRQDAELEIAVPAPALPIRCNGLPASRISDLHGKAVRVVAEGAGTEPPPAPMPPQLGVGVVTVRLRANDAEDDLPPGICAAAAEAAWPTFAVLAAVTPDRLPGAEFLIDPNGWLRAVRVRDDPAGWHTSDQLAAAVRGICTSPIQQTIGDDHVHHH